MKFSIVIPAKDEEAGLAQLLPDLTSRYPGAEVIVVNDGSTDNTEQVCRDAGVKVVTHPYAKGNGAAVKAGARAATGDYIVFMDGDGQHAAEDVERLVTEVQKGYDLVVGARSGKDSQANVARWSANAFYNAFASWMVDRKIPDLTSGFRCVDRRKFLSFLYLLPNGFSYPTTSTMAFFRAGYSVGFVPITVSKRIGKSHINLVKDGIRFLLIIFKVGTLYSPLKVYFPVAAVTFSLGLLNYLVQITNYGLQFTNMSAMLMLAGVIMFLIGLLSEQLTNLQFKDSAVEAD